MAERIFVQGNEALGWGAIDAGCRHFFGYPITPQNEITEFFARELPKVGGIFIQSEAETSSINMLYGAAAAGVRALTSTSSPGFSLMQETFSHLANAQLPCVVVDVQRGGPGQGTTQHAQMDYRQATKGGGHGGYRLIVVAPSSIQECYEHIQLAFYLADKYWNPVIVLSDGVIGQMSEPLARKPQDFPPVPEKWWALKGTDNKGGKHFFVSCMRGVTPDVEFPSYKDMLAHCDRKYKTMEREELRYETIELEDAEIILVAYGYTARVSKEALLAARAEGLKVGMVRPITVWPFPYDVIRQKARRGAQFVVVEDSLGQLVDDVLFAVEGRTEVRLVGILDRHSPNASGMILPHRVLEEVKKLT